MNDTMKLLVILTEGISVGTNLAFVQFMWMLVSGALLPNRGAIFPALKAIGLTDEATRRAWVAFRKGVWKIAIVLRIWQAHIEGFAGWQVHRHEGYVVIAVDITAFWRPALQGCPSKHYHPSANRALPAVIFGIVGKVGEINGQRIACPRAFQRVHPKDTSEKQLWRDLLRFVSKTLAKDEIVAVDAGVKISALQAAEIGRYVVRLAVNFTARRNQLAEYSGQGRKPIYGELIRPLARAGKDKTKTIAASQPDQVEIWVENGREIRARIWTNLVLPKVKSDKQNKTFHVYAIYDPKHTTPWVLATPLLLKAETVKAIYQDRWPVEQIPLAAKQMVGAHRQFVYAKESVQRLPELALLAGSVLTFLAAITPAMPTGFWDLKPKRTPGRFRRKLMGKPFPETYPFPPQLRKKASVTAHLPKGNAARQQKCNNLAPAAAP